MTSLPLCWFLDDLYRALRLTVRPPTRKATRRLIEVVAPLPREAFEAFMEPCKDGDAPGLTRDAEGRLVPTRETQACRRFIYLISRPMVTDRLFQLEKADLTKGPWAKEGKGAWRRGKGCARLRLPSAAQKLGQLAVLMSFVTSNHAVEYREPKRWNAMPHITMRYFVATASHQGHFNWPAKFTDMSRALLVKLARLNITEMLADPEYPIDPRMQAAVTSRTDKYYNLKQSNNDPTKIEGEQEAVTA